nr:UvrD-helicase domain-containing protein [Lachnospiraceae bacterium]
MNTELSTILNGPQLEGVITTEGPVLILAGAGSGKTRVLVHRIAYLIDEKNVSPWQIMAITFTNKAAGEMKNRVSNEIGPQGDGVWISTFHSACVRILRRFADHIGYDTNFSIYDSDDSKTVMKNILKDLNIDSKRWKERFFLGEISSAKNELIGPEEYASRISSDPTQRMLLRVYREYQSRLRASNAMDFDDLIINTVMLFKTDVEVLNNYNNKLKYIMVDEYQDTNTAQFELVRLLAGSKNLCVVGDDDQSIYKFRGANIRNILDFERHFPDAKVIRLEQNYRSVGNILDAANGVIANNLGRKTKKLWTDKNAGEKIHVRGFDSAYEEASYIAGNIKSRVYKGEGRYGDFAVLYRTNAQSRMLEEKFLYENIPYKIVGGVNFYQRREIKDILAYLRIIDNPKDDVAVRRILNVPKRGIGAASENKVSDYAAEHDISFYEALSGARSNPLFGRSGGKLAGFYDFIEEKKLAAGNESVSGLIKSLLEDTGYSAELKAEHTDDSENRLLNLDEFISKAADYETTAEEPTLSGFLEEVSLIADIDSLVEGEEYVVLMTL